jgi:hypothetical protein
LKLDPFVAQIIVIKNIDNFTTADVRIAYLTLKKDPSLDSSNVRRKIYSELLKLVKKGWLNKLISRKKGLTRFSKTELFNYDEITLKLKRELDNKIEKNYDTQGQLRFKLKSYKTELLLSIGESEAYKELYSEFPPLINELQPQYNKAKDNNTKILGKIRAVEGLLKQGKSIEGI